MDDITSDGQIAVKRLLRIRWLKVIPLPPLRHIDIKKHSEQSPSLLGIRVMETLELFIKSATHEVANAAAIKCLQTGAHVLVKPVLYVSLPCRHRHDETGTLQNLAILRRLPLHLVKVSEEHLCILDRLGEKLCGLGHVDTGNTYRADPIPIQQLKKAQTLLGHLC